MPNPSLHKFQNFQRFLSRVNLEAFKPEQDTEEAKNKAADKVVSFFSTLFSSEASYRGRTKETYDWKMFITVLHRDAKIDSVKTVEGLILDIKQIDSTTYNSWLTSWFLPASSWSKESFDQKKQHSWDVRTAYVNWLVSCFDEGMIFSLAQMNEKAGKKSGTQVSFNFESEAELEAFCKQVYLNKVHNPKDPIRPPAKKLEPLLPDNQISPAGEWHKKSNDYLLQKGCSIQIANGFRKIVTVNGVTIHHEYDPSVNS